MKSCCRATIESLLSGDEVAEALGISRVHVHRIATRKGIGTIVGKTRVFTPEDVETMRNRGPRND